MNTFPLARWFTPAPEANEFLREDLLGDLYAPRVVAKRGDGAKGVQLIVRTERQTCVIEHKTVQGCPLVTFDSVANDKWEHVSFWFNLSSVQDLLAELEEDASADPDAFDVLFLGVRPERAA